MKLTFCSNVVIFIRCFILASAILGIPALAITWDWLPGSWNAAVAAIIPNRADREFETVTETSKTLANELPIAAELPIEFTKWGDAPLINAEENEMYGAEATVVRSESSLTKGFEVRAANVVSEKRPEDAVVLSPTLVRTSSTATSFASYESAQYYRGEQNNAPNRNDLLKEELTTLGVERFNLQLWGNSGNLWRCSCQVPDAGGGCAICFEAVDTDSNRAITMVLTKIRDWKAKAAAQGI